jgi:hypothetical protein
MYGITIMAIDTKPRPGIRKRVQMRIEQGVCLQCDDAAERLGCCGRHYRKFRSDKNELPLNEREMFQAREIRAGRIAVSRQGERTDLQRAG